ncbi:MAG: GIY-YIG nuclease family protein [Patescibacteria group bacterium]
MPPCGRKQTMYAVYILKSLQNGRHYIGHTDDLSSRLVRHNRGDVKATKAYRPWKVVYTETYTTRSAAYRRELGIKKYKGGIQFKNLFAQPGEVA